MPLSTHLIQIIQNNKAGYLSLANANLWDHHIDELLGLLNQKKHIVSLNLSENNLCDEGIKKLASLSHVYSLNVSRVVSLNDETAIFLVRSKHLNSLNLSRNRGITDVAGQVMLLEASQTYLNIDGTSINFDLHQKVAERINENRSRPVENTNKYKSDSNQGKFLPNGSAFFVKEREERKDKPPAESKLTL